MMLKKILIEWKNYRRRFLPWLVCNLQHHIEPGSDQLGNGLEGTISSTEITNCLKAMLSAFDTPCKDAKTALKIFGADSVERRQVFETCGKRNREILLKQFGFDLEIRKSAMPGAGKGVFVKDGKILRGQVAALYPGLIYFPHQPILFQSIRNSYIFRCADGMYIDGNYKGLSAMLYRSIHGRDRIGSQIPICDISWLHLHCLNEKEHECESNSDFNRKSLNLVANPLNIGQIVNNANIKIVGHSPNLSYYEITLSFGMNEESTFQNFFILGLIPNAYYKRGTVENPEQPFIVKIVALVAIKDILEGDELLATYFTIINK